MKGTKYYALCIINFALLILLSGCIEEYEADISEEDSDLLVVEGTICSGKWNIFTLTRTQAIRSDEPLNSDMNAYYNYIKPRTVTGASVSVHGSDGTEYRAQQMSGYYSCWVGDLSPDVEYYLHIEADGEVYESEPQKPLRTEEIADVIGVQNTPENSIDVLVTPAAPSDPNKTHYYSWTYEETWEVLPEYRTNMYYDLALNKGIFKMHQFPERGWKSATGTTLVATSVSYEGQHIRRVKLYDIDRGDERMYFKYSGLVQQRAISKAEYEYFLAQRQAASEMGGLFTPLPSALPTNIHCLTSNKHVIGFVGCSLNTSKYRFFLKPTDYSIDRPYPKDARLWLNDCDEYTCYRMVTKEGMYLCEWKDERYQPNGTLQTAWAYDYQLDVRLKGASDVEPDFWSLDENISY